MSACLRWRAAASILLSATCLPLCAADAGDTETLLRQLRCHGCHETDRALIGPSYQAIAARHAERREVMVQILADKIIEGGAGNWGVVPMVPNEHVTPEEARAIARWILEQR